jgi:hypothetical protein
MLEQQLMEERQFMRQDDIYIEMRIAPSIKNVEEIFMYFDDDKTYYKLYCNIYECGALINYAIEKGDSSFMNKFQLINKLKAKNKIFFRLKLPYDEVLNVSFSLNNSSSALNKAMDLSSISSNENATYAFELLPKRYRLKGLLNNLSSSVTKHSFTEDFSLTSFQEKLTHDLGQYSLYKIGFCQVKMNCTSYF